MRVIDFISSGSEPLIYVIRSSVSNEIYWRGNRQDFIREMSAFFLFFNYPVSFFTCEKGVICLYI